MKFETLKFNTPEPGIGVITMNRPERLNALNLNMLEDFFALFDHLNQNDEIRVIIITGEGRGFCSGADLQDERFSRKNANPFSNAADHLMKIQKVYARLIIEMRRLSQPIIAAVNGHAAGGGMCIALASDVAIASPAAAFTPSFVNIGLTAGELGTSYFLHRLVGLARAADILFTGRTVAADEAEKIGIVSRLVEDDQLMTEALAIARAMLDKTSLGLRLTKETISQNLNAPSLEAAMELENRNQSILCLTPEFFEAVVKFGERRKDAK
jgi:enoyl-CoA hydratase